MIKKTGKISNLLALLVLPLLLVHNVLTASEKETAQLAQFKNMKAEMEIVFKNWEVNIQIPDDTFRYTPPDDSKPA